MDCIFCQIATKLRHNVVWEDALFWIIYDGFPIASPHLLIIPKTHILCYGKLPADEFSHLETIMTLVSSKIKKSLLFFEQGDIGQTVKHAHLHAIPFEGNEEDAIAELNLPGATKEISKVSDVMKFSQYFLFIKPGGKMLVFLPEAGAVFGPAPVTNSLAKHFGKPYPAANRPPPTTVDVEAARTLFTGGFHGS